MNHSFCKMAGNFKSWLKLTFWYKNKKWLTNVSYLFPHLDKIITVRYYLNYAFTICNYFSSSHSHPLQKMLIKEHYDFLVPSIHNDWLILFHEKYMLDLKEKNKIAYAISSKLLMNRSDWSCSFIASIILITFYKLLMYH